MTNLTDIQSNNAAPLIPEPVSYLDSSEFAALLSQLTKDFAETAADFDRNSEFPHANFTRLHQHGLLALTVPTELGGYGATLSQTRRVVSAVAKGEPSTALVLVMQYLQHSRLQQNQAWPLSLREQVALDAVKNGALTNALRVEPELGTPARGGLPKTVAKRHADGWLINGHKIYSTGIAGLTWLTVWAHSDEAEPKVGSWLVHRDTPGIKVVETWDHLGMRATSSHDVIFEDVFVPEQYAVDVRPVGHDRTSELDTKGVLWLSVLLSSIYDAVAQAARDWLVQWLHGRVPANLGASLATLPRFQEIVGRIDALLLNNKILLDSAAGGHVPLESAAQIKYIVTSNAIKAVEEAIAATGNPGLSRHHALERHYRDVLCSRIHTPQNDAILLAAGRAALSGKPRGAAV
ncbi:acyl-CoA dehydrogenase family protein [Aquirhabdus parva]|uniref:Acyl-CoA dehydrogenase n=1 Tax=Aquirhabdus parva TaxID=2283318 RepID=A0A345P5L8_9GAMM|nr:acyl-CoA dehydrogenase family protein [Aquirhabdus parva]AXI02577.1 acyl-CoA dehydrogenase [Aquirhabdus parva]